MATANEIEFCWKQKKSAHLRHITSDYKRTAFQILNSFLGLGLQSIVCSLLFPFSTDFSLTLSSHRVENEYDEHSLTHTHTHKEELQWRKIYRKCRALLISFSSTKKPKNGAHKKHALALLEHRDAERKARERDRESDRTKQSVRAVAECETKRTDSVINKLVRNFLLTIRRGTIKIIKSSQ